MAGADGNGGDPGTGSGLESGADSGDSAPPSAPATERGVRTTVATYAELVRLPNLFTAPPDVVLGAALVAAAGSEPSVGGVVGLAIASMCLYAGGTTLNDAFDAPVDRRERPERPIPSGRVPQRTAFGLGAALLLVGVAVAGAASGLESGLVAGLLAAAITAYDGLLKGTAAGFLTMGTTRGLNVVLGMTAVGPAILEVNPTVVVVPAATAIYIATVTFMAARETEGKNRGAVVVAVAGVAVALLALARFLTVVQPPPPETTAAIAFAGAFGWWVGGSLRAAYAEPIPEKVGPAVGTAVLGLVLLDAAFAAVAGVGWSVAAAVFLVPAISLARAFDVT